mmetsp:Transcript_55838/g.130904  ORF Transcript_55838/g.130904 Transcript_55838/m.130904 type:complete len:386 (-) Transcript_55838:70-1227(-)
MSMFLLLGHWLYISGAVTLRGSDLKEKILPTDESQIGVVPMGQNATGLANSTYMYNSSQLSILIPETRPLVTLPVVALQAHTHFPELRIQILYGSENKEYVQTQKTLAELLEKGVLLLTPMPGSAYTASRLPENEKRIAYSKALTSPEFWQLTTTPKVLLAQADTWICNGAREHLRDFLQYDYVGAPWPDFKSFCPKKPVGNGGFSLRDREAMLRITKSSQVNRHPEDAYFCSHLQDSEKLPSKEAAKHFAREQFSPEEKKLMSSGTSGTMPPSVGVHNLWVSPELVRQVFEGQCPGVSLVNPRVEALDNSEGTLGEAMVQRWRQEALPRTVALLQDSGRGILDFVSLKLTTEIFREESLHDPLLVDFLRETAETWQWARGTRGS